MFEQLKALLVEEIGIDPDDIKLESELSADLGINSIELADLVMLCEERFEITIDDSDIGRFVTIKDVVDYLETLEK
ncbi:MAG: acyl carrier protein [Ruminococcaceae bacterium]|nr:acyl carrier protein [Oscillospiraceae bacterium]